MNEQIKQKNTAKNNEIKYHKVSIVHQSSFGIHTDFGILEDEGKDDIVEKIGKQKLKIQLQKSQRLKMNYVIQN